MAISKTLHTEAQIWDFLREVTDPEIPVLNIVEMGIARKIDVDEKGKVLVKITPTYSGCPAMNAIEKLVKEKLAERNVEDFVVKLDFAETWTTDWMTDEAKIKLKNYGIAPPDETGDSEDDFLKSLSTTKVVPCPFCDSFETELVSQFGSTACKAQYFCKNCEQPFEHFKCI
ncbi:1,2-phenylacetyl-CoA epoxidase subunit PaaD [Gracilimonas mengyeensis]|uniref:Ring-1,2-phenylacetyl-CoA epoxidase subunit PaaD n=1 Tax=Gracilimonas mengyeensis TaxID=1302730 RepID=A0A521E3Q9_9BACT|nr:1,2-phenylacetyl-CoA epoxidase subunit PaaD [Gracilimonas mengyeensis]SMO78586.1 ring-1,2-phenylacetyl-CoA epoxidase subunit PaaD [Gracilimonas mengyeensis]